MRRILSNQVDVSFVWCPSPVTIDKSAAWGPGNFQKGPEGAFLKMKSSTEVSHLVQPNAGKSAPIGWIAGSKPGLFTKAPIWVDGEVLEAGAKKYVVTRDGPIDYEAKEPSMVCYNGDEESPDMSDGWVQSLKEIRKNYIFEDAAANA